MRIFVFFILFAMVLCGCAGNYEIVNMEAIRGNAALQKELDKAIEKLGDHRGGEQFDLNDRTYLLMTGGAGNSGGYTIKVISYKEEQNEIIIAATVKPPSTPTTLAVIENPKLLLSMNKSNKPIRLVWG